MRISAANSSPWAPVAIIMILFGGYFSMSSMGTMWSSSTRLRCLMMSTLFLMLRPSITTFLPYLLAMRMNSMIRSTCEAKVAMITRPGTLATIESIFFRMKSSEGEKPGFSIPVESMVKRRTFLSLNILYCSTSLSVGTPFSLSTLTSPVFTMSPRGVSIITPVESGIECVSPKKRTFKFGVIAIDLSL